MEQARRYKLDSGLPVLATTKAIYNEESCYTADCHHHNELQSILGTLDVGLSELPLQESLSTMGKRLVAFTIMLTILVIGGVAALLQLNVVAPLRKLTDYLHAVSVGDDSGEAPELSGELKTIVYAIRRIKKSIDKHD
ncbi:MAG: hypothetical protein C0609_07615 [Deltaproteobacteria bacterium]|nr:MAG: hypothetical protein C0609_07615 [Deltaproteobacteria bacterium]